MGKNLPRRDLEARSGVLGKFFAVDEGGRFRRRLRSVNASPDLATLTGEAHFATVQKVSDGGHSLAIIFAVAAHCEDQIPEAVVIGAMRFFEVLFHDDLGWRVDWLALDFSRSSAKLLFATDFVRR
jgi:hypothetical protein